MKAFRYLAPLLLCTLLSAQVYSPKLLAEGQPDSSDLTKLVEGIYAQAHAHTPHDRAEAIWRFFLTDGRFVKPGFWYHIAGWAYEEPYGEVLDPIKLLNSYGFGLCYHIAPLLQAAFRAGGFQDARCWFLTGHTVTEVFYDGAYHYFDSDMMGYNVAGDGPFAGKPVVSVQQLERDPGIMLGKLLTPDHVKPETVDNPWYPADVHAKAIGDLASLFTTTSDNFLYAGNRYSAGHTMDFVLRPGEKLIRFFKRRSLIFTTCRTSSMARSGPNFLRNFRNTRYEPKTARAARRMTAPGPPVESNTRRSKAWISPRSESRCRVRTSSSTPVSRWSRN